MTWIMFQPNQYTAATGRLQLGANFLKIDIRGNDVRFAACTHGAWDEVSGSMEWRWVLVTKIK